MPAVWGALSSSACIDDCYEEAVHWIGNLFKVPSGNAGKNFVKELAKLIRAYTEDSTLQLNCPYDLFSTSTICFTKAT